MQKNNPFLVTAFLLVFSASLLVSCRDKHRNTAKEADLHTKEFQDKLIEANKMYVRRESDEIDQYVAHRGWQMTTSGTGLRYMITRRGTGPAPVINDRVKVKYRISLLDGTLCYTSDSLGPKEFIVGMDNVESGLHEGIQYMHVGDQAVMILPSHLAHGLMGDESKIPPHASVVYELELLSLKSGKKE